MSFNGNKKKRLFSDKEMFVAYDIDFIGWEVESIKPYQGSLGVGGVEQLLGGS